jgi:hypothetical protein
MPNGSPRYHIDATWRIVRAINAFFRALSEAGKAKGWQTWRDRAPKRVWNFE